MARLLTNKAKTEQVYLSFSFQCYNSPFNKKYISLIYLTGPQYYWSKHGIIYFIYIFTSIHLRIEVASIKIASEEKQQHGTEAAE